MIYYVVGMGRVSMWGNNGLFFCNINVGGGGWVLFDCLDWI